MQVEMININLRGSHLNNLILNMICLISINLMKLYSNTFLDRQYILLLDTFYSSIYDPFNHK